MPRLHNCNSGFETPMIKMLEIGWNPRKCKKLLEIVKAATTPHKCNSSKLSGFGTPSLTSDIFKPSLSLSFYNHCPFTMPSPKILVNANTTLSLWNNSMTSENISCSTPWSGNLASVWMLLFRRINELAVKATQYIATQQSCQGPQTITASCSLPRGSKQCRSDCFFSLILSTSRPMNKDEIER